MQYYVALVNGMFSHVMADGPDVRVIRYRADIDGLRAVAVLSVLLFHIDFSWVPGGFTGVDIFFVISGFLITRIIGREIERGTFSFRAFYVRRIRRILPVFYTVLVCTMVAGAVLLLPADLQAFLASLRRALYFTANLYFAKDRGYFDISADEKPLLHTWSLSIEEQYYFIWPLLLTLFYMIGVWLFRQRRVLDQATATALAAGMIVVGVIYSQVVLVAHPGEIKWYFVIQTRFSELMIGALTALLPFRGGRRWVLQALALAGASLVAIGLFVLTKESRFPGINSLLPCVGAALLIYSGQGVQTRSMWLHRLLGLRVMVLIGLMSYSMYLWHWPILAYMRYVYGSYALPWPWVVWAVVLTMTLSFLSYRFVERTTRHVRVGFSQAFLGMFVLPALVLAGASFVVQKSRPVVSVPTDLATYGTDVCHGNFDQRCVRGDPAVAPSVLVTGDSHAAALNDFIDDVGRHEGWSASVLTGSSCSPVFGYDEEVLPAFAQKPCVDLKTYVAQHWRDYRAVVLASYWAYQLDMTELRADPRYLEKFVATVREMAKAVPVYVISDVPRLPIEPFREQWFLRLGLHVHRPVSDKYLSANAIVRRAVEQIPNAHWVDLGTALKGFQPLGQYQGAPAYFDEQHLNMVGSRALGEMFVHDGGQLVGRTLAGR